MTITYRYTQDLEQQQVSLRIVEEVSMYRTATALAHIEQRFTTQLHALVNWLEGETGRHLQSATRNPAFLAQAGKVRIVYTSLPLVFPDADSLDAYTHFLEGIGFRVA